MAAIQQKNSFPDLENAAKDAKEYFILSGIFSAASNLLMLVPILYMLQVYDRVISSGSYATLAMLTILMVALMSASGGFEWTRSKLLVGASSRLDKSLRTKTTKAAFKGAYVSGGNPGSAAPINDLQGLRQFLTGNGIFAFFETTPAAGADACRWAIVILHKGGDSFVPHMCDHTRSVEHNEILARNSIVFCYLKVIRKTAEEDAETDQKHDHERARRKGNAGSKSVETAVSCRLRGAPFVT